MANKTTLARTLKNSSDDAERFESALALLQASTERQHVDNAMAALQDLPDHLRDEHRAILRERAEYYYANEDRDKAGMVREGITRLLVHLNNPADRDLYLRGVNAYYLQPLDDVAQNLRAAALAGLAACDRALSIVHATRLICEAHVSVFNCEPAMTAVDVLVRYDQRAVIYGFALQSGEAFARAGKGEVVGKALESLGDDFPTADFHTLVEPLLALDVPSVSAGAVNAIVNGQRDALYDLLAQIITETSRAELHQYTTIMLATSRTDALTQMLYRLAEDSPKRRVQHFIEAVELTFSEEKDAVLAALQARQ